MAEPALSLSISARRDGTLEAAYIRISEASVERTEEVISSVLLVDFDGDDNVVGIEILSPISVDDVHRVAERLSPEQKDSFNKFVDQFAPRSLVTA